MLCNGESDSIFESVVDMDFECAQPAGTTQSSAASALIAIDLLCIGALRALSFQTAMMRWCHTTLATEGEKRLRRGKTSMRCCIGAVLFAPQGACEK